MNAALYRFESAPTHTLGRLDIAGAVFYIIERPWLDNRANVSCIPPGTYRLTFLPRSASGKYRRVYWVRNVPNRVGCLIHNGNKASQSRGCLIIGMRCGWLGGDRAVLNSRSALDRLGDLTGGADITLTITKSGGGHA